MALGLALAAFFVFPALLEFRFVRSDQWYGGYYDFHDHFVYLAQLFDPRWGFGISTPGPNDPISYQLGLAAFVLAALAFWGWLRKGSRYRLEIGFWLLALVAGIGLATALAAPLWDHVPFVSSAQFPWRYLALAAVALAALAPGGCSSGRGAEIRIRWDWLAPLLLAGLLIVEQRPLFARRASRSSARWSTLAWIDGIPAQLRRDDGDDCRRPGGGHVVAAGRSAHGGLADRKPGRLRPTARKTKPWL